MGFKPIPDYSEHPEKAYYVTVDWGVFGARAVAPAALCLLTATGDVADWSLDVEEELKHSPD